MKEINLGSRISGFVQYLGVSGFLIYTVVTVAVLTWSLSLVVPQVWSSTTSIFVLLPVPVVIAELSGRGFIVFTLFLWISALGSVSILVWRYLRDSVLKDGGSWRDSDLYKVYLVFVLTLVFSLGYRYALNLFGTGISSAAGPEAFWQRMYLLTRAAVWEEVLVRFGLIGVPAAAIGMYKGKGDIADLFGGFGFERKYVMTLLLFSTFIFTLGHVPGWNLWKLPQVLVPGLLFGYLFISVGLHAAIGVHLLWNLLGMTEFALGSEIYSGVIAFFILIWLIAGVFLCAGELNKIFLPPLKN